MKSSLKIALGTGNEPVIHLNIVPTDDIRDQLCCQFLHKLGGVSTMCKVSIQGDVQLGSPITHLLEISPLSPDELPIGPLKFPSKYQIEDPISTEDIFDGEVVAVKFTIGKVYYDILDKLSGKVIENVDSALVNTSSSPAPAPFTSQLITDTI